MIEQSLDDQWVLREVGSAEWIPARVPGGVHLDLLAAGRIADPFVGDEELRAAWVAERDWEYRREFTVDPAVASHERVELTFEGLDTLAEVSLNGEPLGSADNMFRSWRWDVTGRLRAGSNDLGVVLPVGGAPRVRAGRGPAHGQRRRPASWRPVPAPATGDMPAAQARAIVRLRSDTLARWVELRLDGAEPLFDDNYFDVPAGRPVQVTFERPTGWTPERARDALRIRSVADTYMDGGRIGRHFRNEDRPG